jgi:hypothetical protein
MLVARYSFYITAVMALSNAESTDASGVSSAVKGGTGGM